MFTFTLQLVSLKAELSRKQDEVQKAKSNKPTTSEFICNSTKLKRNKHETFKKDVKEKVEEQSLPDIDTIDEDSEALKRSR